MSGLLASVVTELAVFLLGDSEGGEEFVISLDELLDSHEKALASFRGGGCAGAGAAAGACACGWAGGTPGEVGAAAAGVGVSRLLVES
jgi:hypothetical protein